MQKSIFMIYAGILVIGVALGFFLRSSRYEGFVNVSETSCNVCERKPCSCKKTNCDVCRNNPCGCARSAGSANVLTQGASIDMSKYILKASVPPCPSVPDLSNYILKSECPAPPDMSKYVLKSAVPACPPCISTCNKPCKIGECPPCPRTRCPVVQCPEPRACPPCASVEPPRCPEPSLTCKTQYPKPSQGEWIVRPLLSTINDM